MRSEQKRTMQKNELVLWEENVAEEPGFFTKMFSYNCIRGILPFVAEKMDSRIQYRYDIGTRKSLPEWIGHGKMNGIQLDALVRNIIEIIENGREYLIDETDYVLCPEYIFFSESSEQVYLCCYPRYQGNLQKQLADLFEFLLNQIDYQDLSAVGIAYELYMKSKAPGCRFVDMLSILERYTTKGEAEDSKGEKENEVNASERLEAPSKEAGEKEDVIFAEQAGALELSEFCLLAERKKDSISITTFPCYISQKGETLSGEAEGVAIGKLHAKISIRGEVVYIEDMKSEGGTFVNGRRIAGNEIHRLNAGDSVMLADRCYRFVRVG